MCKYIPEAKFCHSLRRLAADLFLRFEIFFVEFVVLAAFFETVVDLAVIWLIIPEAREIAAKRFLPRCCGMRRQ